MPNQAWGAFLESLEWDHLVTLTTKRPWLPTRLQASFREAFIRPLERLAQRRIDWFLRLEESARHHPHLHALLFGTSDLTCRDLQSRWPKGYSRVSVFRPHEGAGLYLSKGIESAPDSYWLSRRLPPRREALRHR